MARAAKILIHPDCLDRRIEIEGHADYFGGRLYNQALSIRRAQVVLEALLAAGVEPVRAGIIGEGESLPEYVERTRDARAKNRRVVLTLVK